MLFSRVHRRFTTWLALLAVVLGALAPTVAQAVVASSDRAAWVEICSVSGMVWVKADTGERAGVEHDGPAPMGDAAQHCAWCSLHGAAGLPPLITVAEPAPRQTGLPPAFYRAVALSGTWAPPQARAPPLSA
eukprot:Opistho-1_new@60513